MKIDKQLLKGSMRMLVLQMLSKEPNHGYAISSKLKELSQERVTITEGTLYPLLHTLQTDDYITSKVQSIGERKRKVYQLTPKGLKLLKEKKKEWAQFSSIMDSLMTSRFAKV